MNDENIISAKIINNNHDESNDKAIFCTKCYNLALISVSEEKEKEYENEDIILKITCENNHIEKIHLKMFLKKYKNYSFKECPLCYFAVNINQLYYCFICKEIVCFKCKEKYHSNDNGLIQNQHIIVPFALKNKICKDHNYKTNEFFCKSCKKCICKECLIDHQKFPHYLINLYNINNIIKNKFKMIIDDEEKSNKKTIKRFNNLLIKVNNYFNKNIEYEKKALNIKKYVLNTYESDITNYNNIQSLYLCNKNFYKKKEKKYNELCKKLDININNDYKEKINDNNRIYNLNHNKSLYNYFKYVNKKGKKQYSY